MSRPTEDLIFDRTIQDVQNATLKGQYNVSDINRVESWCKFLADSLNDVGYNINITTKTNWNQTNMRTAVEMERVRTNIKKIMQGYYYITNIVQNAEYFDYLKANNFEKILFEIWNMMLGMRGWYVYGGVANGGQSRVWQHRFRTHFYRIWTDLTEVYWSDFGASTTWEVILYENND